MSNRCIRATFDFTRQQSSQVTTWVEFARDTASGFLTTAHHALMALGILAILTLGVMFFKPDLADELKAFSPFTEADAETQPEPQATELAALPSQLPVASRLLAGVLPQQAALKQAGAKQQDSTQQQQRITSWLSRRYRVASDATNMLVSAAYQTAKEIKLDPLLILSVIAIESGFNPFAESPVGAQGLMQVMSKVNHDKFQPLGGVKAALNPLANIRVGSLILKDYVTRGGSLEAGLKLYVGAGNLPTDSGYGARVLAEYHRLQEVAMGKKVSIYATAAPKPQAPEPKVEAAGEPATATNEPSKPATKPERLAAL